MAPKSATAPAGKPKSPSLDRSLSSTGGKPKTPKGHGLDKSVGSKSTSSLPSSKTTSPTTASPGLDRTAPRFPSMDKTTSGTRTPASPTSPSVRVPAPLKQTTLRHSQTTGSAGFRGVSTPKSAGNPALSRSHTMMSPVGRLRHGATMPIEQEEEAPPVKVWVRVLGPDGQDQRMRAENTIIVTELRKMVKTKVGVPVNELELRLPNGAMLTEGVQKPFKDMPIDAEFVVHWYRADRLQSLLHHRNLADLNSLGKFDRTALHFAVLDGDPELCKRIVDHKERAPQLLDIRDVFRDTPLMLASIMGYVELVEILIDRQADISCQNLCGRTALQMASEHGHAKVVKALLLGNADLGPSQPVMGMMGAHVTSKSAPYLGELNERGRVLHRIHVYKLSQQKQEGLDL